MKILSQDEIEKKLKTLPLEWAVVSGTQLELSMKFADFKQALEYVRMSSKMCSPHAASIVAVREAPLDELAPPRPQVLSTITANPSSISVHGIALRRLVFPTSTTSIRL